MSSDWPILTKLRCKLQRGCYAQATCLATLQKKEGRSTFLAPRNATSAVAKWGVTREFFLQLATKRLLRCKLQEELLRVTWPLRTFAPIVTAHPYCARKFTCHVMHRARALSNKMNNDRADCHC